MAHYHIFTGHPGIASMHQTLQRTSCWPQMAAAATSTVRDCVSCAKSGVNYKNERTPSSCSLCKTILTSGCRHTRVTTKKTALAFNSLLSCRHALLNTLMLFRLVVSAQWMWRKQSWKTKCSNTVCVVIFCQIKELNLLLSSSSLYNSPWTPQMCLLPRTNLKRMAKLSGTTVQYMLYYGATWVIIYLTGTQMPLHSPMRTTIRSKNLKTRGNLTSS